MIKRGNFIRIIGLDITDQAKVILDTCALTNDDANNIIDSFYQKNTIFIRIPCEITYKN